MGQEQKPVKEVRREGAALVVVLAGEIDMRHTPDVHSVLLDACRKQPSVLVVNLEEVTHLDSSGIGMLVDVFRRVKEFGGQLALCGVRPEIYALFEITRLNALFSFYPTEAEALSA